MRFLDKSSRLSRVSVKDRQMAREKAVEVELKLEAAAADLDALARELATAGFATKRIKQRSIYFDTADLDLRVAGVSLRIREARGRRIQTAKAAGASLAGLFARSEWDKPVTDDRPVPDERIPAPLSELLSERALVALQPVFTVNVERRAGHDEQGQTRIEAAVDQGEVIAGGQSASIAEIELELIEGDPAALFALAQILNEVAPVRLGVLTKSERGYRLLDGTAEKPSKAEPGIVSGPVTTAQAFAAITSACLKQFRLNEDLLARTGDGAALHQARVALRRLRTALSIFKRLVVDGKFERLRTESRWLAATLGEARDIDVLIARGSDETVLSGPRDEAYSVVRDALASARARALMLDLAEWSAIGEWRTASAEPSLIAEPAERFAAMTLDRLRRRLKKAGRRLSELDDEARHAVRIEAKKLRYAAEFFSGLFGRPRRAKRFLAAMERLQKHLGELNDIAAAPAVLGRLGLAQNVPAALSHDRLIAKAAVAYADLMDRKAFWIRRG